MFLQEDGAAAKSEIKIKLPDEMKRWLIDDHDFINRQKRVRMHTVQTYFTTLTIIVHLIHNSMF